MKESIEMSNTVAIHLLFTSLVDETNKDCLQSPSHLRHLIVFLVVLGKKKINCITLVYVEIA